MCIVTYRDTLGVNLKDDVLTDINTKTFNSVQCHAALC